MLLISAPLPRWTCRVIASSDRFLEEKTSAQYLLWALPLYRRHITQGRTVTVSVFFLFTLSIIEKDDYGENLVALSYVVLLNLYYLVSTYEYSDKLLKPIYSAKALLRQKFNKTVNRFRRDVIALIISLCFLLGKWHMM